MARGRATLDSAHSTRWRLLGRREGPDPLLPALEGSMARLRPSGPLIDSGKLRGWHPRRPWQSVTASK